MASTNNTDYLKQIFQNKDTSIKSRKNEYLYWNLHIQIGQAPNSSLNWQFYCFDQICPQKLFPARNRKSEQNHWILHIAISLGTKFHFEQKNLNIWTKFDQKGYFQSKTEKNEHHHRILHIRISLGSKFQVKLITLIFWAKFARKRYFQPKTNKKINITLEFFKFKLV